MAWQLIYTSAPRGLVPGHSGFCTVARSSGLREAVAERLEQISSYHYLDPESFADGTRNPIISAYRILDVRGTMYHVLTRIQPSGLDFSSRTNHLAQHLLFGGDELSDLPSPAALLQHWRGWLSRWESEPQILGVLAQDSFKDFPEPTWPARAWIEATGDAGRAAGLLEAEYGRGCYLRCDPTGGDRQLLKLFGETLQLLNPNGGNSTRAWQHTFTTLLQAEDAPADFQWRGCWPGSPAWEQALRRSVDLVQVQAIRVPNNALAKLAREGPPAPSSAVPRPQPAKTVRLEPTRRPVAPLSATDLSRNVLQRPSPHSPPSVSLRNRSLRTILAIAIALLLLASLVGIKRYWSAGDRPLAPNPTNAPAHLPSPAPPPAKSPAHPAAPKADPSSNAVNVAPSLEQLQKLDSFHWQDVPIYVVIVPDLTAEPIPLPDSVPLETLLRQFDRIDLKPGDLDLRFNQQSWDLSPKLPLKTEPRGRSRKLSARGIEPPFLETRFVCDYSGLLDESNNHQPLQVQFLSHPEPSMAFSILFQSAQSQSFHPFRLLVVNESRPPPPLPLSKEFLQGNSASIPDTFRPPFRQRLGQFHLSNATWQLHPFVKAKDDAMPKYLYKDWPADEQPGPAASLDFAAARGLLETRLKSRLAEEAILNEDMGRWGTGFDFSLALGSILGSTNEALATFSAYAVSRDATNMSPDLYLEYLDSLASQPGPQHSWLEPWSAPRHQDRSVVLRELNRLYVLCTTQLSDSRAQLALGGSASNYFAAAWKFLSDDHKRRQIAREIGNIRTRLAQVQEAYVSLCMDMAPNRSLQFVEFSISPEKSP